jgi:predicted ATPase with chaperone activity
VETKFENVATKQDVARQFEEAKRQATIQFEETTRYMGVLSEDLRHKIDIVVEGHQLLNQKIDNLSQEMKEGDRETRAIMKFSYTELDRRVTTVEGGFMALGTRVDRMEDRLG